MKTIEDALELLILPYGKPFRDLNLSPSGVRDSGNFLLEIIKKICEKYKISEVGIENIPEEIQSTLLLLLPTALLLIEEEEILSYEFSKKPENMWSRFKINEEAKCNFTDILESFKNKIGE